MELITLDEYGTTLRVTNFCSESQNVPYNSPETYIGRLEGGNGEYVYATRISPKYYCIFVRPIGMIGKPIPVEVDTFAKLRQWCAKNISGVDRGAAEKLFAELDDIERRVATIAEGQRTQASKPGEFPDPMLRKATGLDDKPVLDLERDDQ